MKRVFLAEPIASQMHVEGDTARHLAFSLRAAVGDLIGVASPDGQTAKARISRILPERVELDFVEITSSPEPLVRVWLLQSLLKGDGMENVIRKAVEIGAYGIVPIQAERCVVRLEAGKAAQRLSRWQKVAQEAAEQSGRGLIPRIETVASIAGVRKSVGTDARIIVLHEECRAGLKTLVREAFDAGKRSGGSHELAVAVGPEGGFSDNELLAWTETGGVPAGMGPRVMRAETAGISALSAILFEAGDMGEH
jgi:16S rRNA (uracil1498-N3)-methyltransferase